MKRKKSRYQQGSIKRLKRVNGYVWQVRFSEWKDGKRHQRTLTLDGAKYPTEKDVHKAVEPQLVALNANTPGGKIAATMNTVIDRYLKEEFPALAHSTQGTNKSLIELHIRPQWSDVRPSDVSAIAVKTWIERLPVGAASKARARNMMSKLLDLAMLWEYIPLTRNPMQLVKVKGSTKRQKKLVILTPQQFKALVEALPEPYNLMVLVSGCLGLRVSEMLGLKWHDFDFDELSVTINQVFTHGRIKELPKTDASGEPLPVPPKLIPILVQWRAKQDHDHSWLFASPRTGSPYSDSTILTDYLKPAAQKLGIKGLGWHTFRHSYKSWLAAAKVDPAHMK